MSRSSHLPPRYPFEKKSSPHPNHEPSSYSSSRITESFNKHHKPFSQKSNFEDPPEWFDDLLSDSDSSPKETYRFQSASDSVTLMDGLVPSMAHLPKEHDKKLCSEGSYKQFEDDCIYGPNSPRRKCNVEFQESSLLLGLSQFVSHSPMQFIDEVSLDSRSSDFEPQGDCHCSSNELNGESKTGKRHPGQRSRARKLQYIAELEKTVDSFQALQLELAEKYSTLLQHRGALSMENGNLKQRMARLKQQKLIMDGEYQTLRKEAERLKLGLASSLSRKLYKYAASSDIETSEMCLQALAWNKLHL